MKTLTFGFVLWAFVCITQAELQGPPNENDHGSSEVPTTEPTNDDRKSSKNLQIDIDPAAEPLNDIIEAIHNRGMHIQTLEHKLEQIESSRVPEENREPTPQEIEAQKMYDEASAKLKSTSGDKLSGYSLLKKNRFLGTQNFQRRVSLGPITGTLC